jgi:hypothetical protein
LIFVVYSCSERNSALITIPKCFADLALSQNEDRALLKDDHRNKMTMMAKHMKQVEHEKKMEVLYIHKKNRAEIVLMYKKWRYCIYARKRWRYCIYIRKIEQKLY